MSLYSRVLENILLPAHNMVRGRRYVQRRKFLEKSQWWSREQIAAFQWDELRKLLDCAFTAPFYQEKYRAAGIRLEDIRSMEDFRKLPILSRAEVDQHREEMKPAGFSAKMGLHATGGSSGRPVRFYRSIDSYDWRTAATQRAYSWSGYRLGERMLFLWGAPVGPQSWFARTKLAWDERLRGELHIPTFSQNEELWTRVYNESRRFRTRFISGYVSSLLNYARFLDSRGWKVSGIRAVVAAAEPLDENARAYLGRVFGAPVFNTYGSREFMSIAAECEQHQGMHWNAENILLETEAPASAGPSALLVTDLHNFATPFIRYAIGDLGLLSESACPCGRGLPLLQSVEGRALDTLRTADGRLISCIFFRHILKDIPEILEYQVEQHSLESVTISAVLSSELSQESRRLFDVEMAKVFGKDMNVQLRITDELARIGSGKRRIIIGLPETAERTGLTQR